MTSPFMTTLKEFETASSALERANDNATAARVTLGEVLEKAPIMFASSRFRVLAEMLNCTAEELAEIIADARKATRAHAEASENFSRAAAAYYNAKLGGK